MTTNEPLAIFDTREPEGNGMPLMCVCGCGDVPMLFATRDEADAWAHRNGHDIDRMIIAPYSDAPIDDPLEKPCPSCGALAGDDCADGC